MASPEPTRKRKRTQYAVARTLWLLRDVLALARLKRAARRVQGVGDRLMITSWRDADG